jgi:eukaryotic-like serine/threonine-protein kinase
MSSSGAESSGRKLGRYNLVAPIGGGPTGEAFRAKVYGVAGLERQFVVKRFHPSLVGSKHAAEAIARAARVYGNLEHPRIARMQEFGIAGGETFAAVELVEGIDVGKLISATYGCGEPFPAGSALTLVRRAARAVGYAHGRGISHMGLCPTNILCGPDGDVKITDFGFLPARLPDTPAKDRTLQARMPYLAPEQILNEDTSAAVDVFQLGVVLYELLSGRRPFTGATSLELSQAILSSAPPDLPLPQPVTKLLQRSLARSPYERYPDASAFADGIEAAMRSAPLPGSAREIAHHVRLVMEQMSQLGEQQMSGALSFPLPAPPTTSVSSAWQQADPSQAAEAPPRAPSGSGRQSAAARPPPPPPPPARDRPSSGRIRATIAGPAGGRGAPPPSAPPPSARAASAPPPSARAASAPPVPPSGRGKAVSDSGLATRATVVGIGV